MTTKSCPTKAAFERLAKLDRPPVFGHMSEVEPWLAAGVAGGFELPDSVLEVVSKGEHLAALHAVHVKPAPHRDSDVDKLLAGATLNEILDADDRAAAVFAHWQRGGTLLIAADGHLAGEAADVFSPHRDSLIVGPLRQATAALLREAKAAAAKLERFHPDYPPGLLSEATMPELEVWRASRSLQSKLETLLTAWQTSWYAATHPQRGPIGPEFYPSRAGSYYAWRNPELVNPETLRLGHDVEILRIVTAPSDYRLLSPSELLPLIDAIENGLPPTETADGRILVRRGVCA